MSLSASTAVSWWSRAWLARSATLLRKRQPLLPRSPVPCCTGDTNQTERDDLWMYELYASAEARAAHLETDATAWFGARLRDLLAELVTITVGPVLSSLDFPEVKPEHQPRDREDHNRRCARLEEGVARSRSLS
jgi:hypothetical protein